uniref:Uncharacterized protein n=1 Tax=Vespula pensylvanica TaxID=30213 RepID=A0A834KGA5_VESPE|nr:hypothetical protein H0235_014973 [Vespula pensylvanica]
MRPERVLSLHRNKFPERIEEIRVPFSDQARLDYDFSSERVKIFRYLRDEKERLGLAFPSPDNEQSYT